MPPNFDTIDEHKYASPLAPRARPGETVLRLDTWVLQPGVAPAWAFLLNPNLLKAPFPIG